MTYGPQAVKFAALLGYGDVGEALRHFALEELPRHPLEPRLAVLNRGIVRRMGQVTAQRPMATVPDVPTLASRPAVTVTLTPTEVAVAQALHQELTDEYVGRVIAARRQPEDEPSSTQTEDAIALAMGSKAVAALKAWRARRTR